MKKHDKIINFFFEIISQSIIWIYRIIVLVGFACIFEQAKKAPKPISSLIIFYLLLAFIIFYRFKWKKIIPYKVLVLTIINYIIIFYIIFSGNFK